MDEGLCYNCYKFYYRTLLYIGQEITECITNIQKQMLTLMMREEAFSLPTSDGSCAENTIKSKKKANKSTSVTYEVTLSLLSKISELFHSVSSFQFRMEEMMKKHHDDIFLFSGTT